eukprot:CAMPEP_0183741714 /NCGR_PEP_ID=MMETSP0737-20130205/62839_1 /TAXON_ID=385413 /ORGANISM="Thalassiosira miniscula, Strain CCMP1093" /LENGTH=68 /DNA_ID=CAMNT_0025977131 /DNA_START=303 /DNA_END=506 /DNA_ORIENTATION=-
MAKSYLVARKSMLVVTLTVMVSPSLQEVGPSTSTTSEVNSLAVQPKSFVLLSPPKYTSFMHGPDRYSG